MTNVYESKYEEPTRPYSQKELLYTHTKLHQYLKLSKTVAFHDRCRHLYLTRKNSKKEAEIKENNTCGNFFP